MTPDVVPMPPRESIFRAVWLPRITFLIMLLGVLIAGGIAEKQKVANEASLRNEKQLKKNAEAMRRVEGKVDAIHAVVVGEAK